MPELPEVETIARDLNKKIKGKKFKSVEVRGAKLVKLSIKQFQREVTSQKVKQVGRRAKLILIELDSNKVLLIHLKLTGQLIFRDKFGKLTAGGHPVPRGLVNLPNKFTHIIFKFSDGSHLFFNDLRKFGWMNIMSKSEVKSFLDSEFGIEPLNKGFTLEKFKQILAQKGRQNIKKVLMDQKNIAGIGNIYADEACFYAGIRPTRLVRTLKHEEIKKLEQGIKKILKAAVALRGTSVDTYVDASGRQGGYTSHLKVYGRGGERCKRCGGTIKKIKLNGRGTHFCSECQL
ncbi:bifunctional DNA-formamidopyrimidine glycosylase/DNA-(apurinic or apyrimidinic site) lyase [Patescibacteria group bacterium]|nr:bifunctional DNA-formamidopyrimidine glycosylase/DNA-(apurinic or apyrimidinic site) lyase [Patescibacteria group bacterium]MBU4511934.1 bifunctional DNA-formamidopyrimidine glycosylase/DNA-(apurinic or apyrimidinic site) lyase [Patescibacteria group bacterium]MCG2692902.1 bifunctional DNA-formamidopyrimidine glycosylase/DNA-(apurinic or apyrimidinic site) lyase [Candidatus Parcubacteria bacterium]